MTSDSDRLFRRLWLVNGFMFLVALVGVIALIAYSFISDTFGGRGPEVRAEPTTGERGDPPTARAVRYSEPQTIRGTGVELIAVHHGNAATLETFGLSGSAAYGGGDGPTVNVIFADPGVAAVRLLLDRPAYIEDIAYPRSREDSLQRFISYSIMFDDSNRDGTLDDEDDGAVYVTDLEGRGLKRASPEGIRVIAHSLTRDGRLLILGVPQPPKGEKAERMPQRAFIHDFARGTTTPLAALDSLAMRAGTVLRGR